MADTELNRMVLDAFDTQRTKDRLSFINVHRTMTNIYSDGVISYCDDEIYQLIKKTRENSTLGDIWVNNGAGEVISDEGYDFIKKFARIEIKRKRERKDNPNWNYPLDYPKGEINDFINVIFELKELQKIKSDFIKSQEMSTNIERTLRIVRDDATLTKREIALICHYNKTFINKHNAGTIAKEFGCEKPGRLYQEYNHFSNDTDRLSISDISRIVNRTKIKLFEKVISKLDDKPKERALDELNTIRNKINNV